MIAVVNENEAAVAYVGFEVLPFSVIQFEQPPAGQVAERLREHGGISQWDDPLGEVDPQGGVLYQRVEHV